MVSFLEALEVTFYKRQQNYESVSSLNLLYEINDGCCSSLPHEGKLEIIITEH